MCQTEMNLMPSISQQCKKQLFKRLENTKNGRTRTDTPLGNMLLNMEMLLQCAILRKAFQKLKKPQSESSKRSMKNNNKRQRYKIFNLLNRSNNPHRRQNDHCFWKNLIWETTHNLYSKNPLQLLMLFKRNWRRYQVEQVMNFLMCELLCIICWKKLILNFKKQIFER